MIFFLIIKYIPLQQGLRLIRNDLSIVANKIIKYIPLQQGLRLGSSHSTTFEGDNY